MRKGLSGSISDGWSQQVTVGEKAAIKTMIHPQFQLKQLMWLSQPPYGRRDFLILGDSSSWSSS